MMPLTGHCTADGIFHSADGTVHTAEADGIGTVHLSISPAMNMCGRCLELDWSSEVANIIFIVSVQLFALKCK